MNAITTKYLGPTDYHGARIRATIEYGSGHQSVTVGYPHEKHDGAEAHSVAALALAKKLGLRGDLIAGATRTGYVFVFATGSERFESTTTDEDYEREQQRITERIDAIFAGAR